MIAPVAEGTPRDIFTKLATQFGLDRLITDYLADTLKLTNLTDFLYLFATGAEVENIVTSKVKDLPNRPLMTARVRQVWAGVKRAQAQAEVTKKRGSEAEDYDALFASA